jgi:hypothetical protein
MHRTWILLSFALLGSACTSRYERDPRPARISQPLQEHLTRDYRACTHDSDCVLALNGCCDCANGGEDIAINREKYKAFRARFSCVNPCTEMGGDCGHGNVACEDKVCVYREPK